MTLLTLRHGARMDIVDIVRRAARNAGLNEFAVALDIQLRSANNQDTEEVLKVKDRK